MYKIISIFFILLVGVCTLSCGGESGPTNDACPAITGEHHLAMAVSEDGRGAMLHVVGRECLQSGVNLLRLYAATGSGMQGDMGGMAPRPLAGMGDMEMMEPVTVTAIAASMPAMHHGTVEDPRIDPDDPSRVEINFQMPGSWLLEYSFQVSDTADKVSFTVDVQ